MEESKKLLITLPGADIKTESVEENRSLLLSRSGSGEINLGGGKSVNLTVKLKKSKSVQEIGNKQKAIIYGKSSTMGSNVDNNNNNNNNSSNNNNNKYNVDNSNNSNSNSNNNNINNIRSDSSNNAITASLPRLIIGKTTLSKSTTKTLNMSNNMNMNISSFTILPDATLDVFGGILTWSLLTMTSENQNEGGTLISLPRGPMDRGTSAKREVWCVLIDKIFYNFASSDRLKPRLHADLRTCYVTPMDAGVFSIDENDNRTSPYSFKTLYFMGKNKKEGARWFWKLYTQSASNSILKYSNLNFNTGKGRSISHV